MRRLRQVPSVLLVSAALLAAGWFGTARAEELPRAPNPDADATRVVEEVLRRAGNGDLGDWTRSIMERALERAGEAARQTVPGSVSYRIHTFPALARARL